MEKYKFSEGFANIGNLYRMKKLYQRAAAGENLTIGFIGGSITQGSLSSKYELCYACRVFDWWVKQFPQSKFTLVNAGVGGTTSQFGVARADKDLLAYEPDFCIIEFSVNDTCNDFYKETYEGLVRKVLGSSSAPAVMTVHNVQYDDGVTAQPKHMEIVKAYELPAFSVTDSIYKKVLSGDITRCDITPDNLHPNDRGHGLLAEGITSMLDYLLCETVKNDYPLYRIPSAVTANRFQNSVRMQNDTPAELKGFTADNSPIGYQFDHFKNGWTADNVGDSIRFTANCSYVGIQFRKTPDKPAPVAQAIVDGDIQNAVILDGNFDQTWGDCLYLENIRFDMKKDSHTIEIRIIDAPKDCPKPFYLLSVIYA